MKKKYTHVYNTDDAKTYDFLAEVEVQDEDESIYVEIHIPGKPDVKLFVNYAYYSYTFTYSVESKNGIKTYTTRTDYILD